LVSFSRDPWRLAFRGSESARIAVRARRLNCEQIDLLARLIAGSPAGIQKIFSYRLLALSPREC
jgi:hypothetical protein